MRKRLVLALVFLLVVVFAFYLIIPGSLRVSQAQYLSIPSSAAVRSFNDLAKRKDWWPSSPESGDDTLTYKNYKFAAAKLFETDLQKIVLYDNKGDTISSLISSNSLKRDSSYIFWECTLQSSYSPIDRIRKYIKAKEIKELMDSILYAFSKYTNTQKNIYGFSITRSKVADSLLISEKRVVKGYPTVQQTYEMLTSLKKYMTEQHAEQTNLSMTSVTPIDSNNFIVLAAIPINKVIPESGNKKLIRFLYNGNILTAEIKGGISSINNAFLQLEHYRNDYKLMTPVVPYQSLITDRIATADTTQWVTKICSPFY